MKRTKTYKKVILSILILAIMISSVCLGKSFAGKSAADVQAAEDTSFLDVKVQHKVKDDGSYDVRFVSSVDKLEGYAYVGFLLEYEGTTYSATTDTVYTRIGASADNLDYKYSPKVVSIASEYFITAVFNVPADKADENLKVTAFYLASGQTERTLGKTRIVNINDGNKNQISMRVDKTLEVGATYDVTVGDLSGTATALDEHNVRIVLAEGSDKEALKSVSTVTLKTAGTDEVVTTGSYRNLLATYTGTKDTTAFADADATAYTVANSADLFGMSAVTGTAGKTIYLVADVTLNETELKDATKQPETWGTTAPTMKWAPIGLSANFDGQGHTVRGLYVKATNVYSGMFGTIETRGQVTNFKLKDSYIEATGSNSNSGVGSVAGRNFGIIDSVYSNAILKNGKKMTGGIVGMITSTTGPSLVQNCWFDGQIWTNTFCCGGILGGSYGATTNIKHCLNTGSITNSVAGSVQHGGLVGYAQGAANVTIEDSLNSGTYTIAESVTEEVSQVGSVIGAKASGATVTVSNVYGVSEFINDDCGSGSVTKADANTGYALRIKDELNGYGAYQWTKLDFENYWVMQEGATPKLAAFAESDLDLDVVKTLSDYNWYDPTKKEFVLSTKEDLISFAEICDKNRNYFEEKTIKLSADIDLNKGWTANATAPTDGVKWTPIAKFGGIFDGDGHTISGIYVYKKGQAGLFEQINDTAIVKNLKIKNSYIQGTSGSGSRLGVGSVAGRCLGTIDTVYSNATIVNSATMTGGIAGWIYAEEKEVTGAKISNCWFDGAITGCYGVGGILGGTYMWVNNTHPITATIEHCLNTGSIELSNDGGYVGGIIGQMQNAGSTITVNDSLNVGIYDGNGYTCKDDTLGTVVGRVTSTSVLTVNNTYGATEFASVLYGTVTTEATNWVDANSSCAALAKENIVGRGTNDITLALTFYEDGQTSADDGETKTCWWVARTHSTPMLESFTDILDYSWYDADATAYFIDDASQLLAFNELGNSGIDFTGKAITLGADIDLNRGWTASATVPKTKWTPIAKFGGIFDGDGHTISGIYVYKKGQAGLFEQINDTAIVKNLKIKNSYIQGTSGSGSRLGVGSVAGRCLGTIDTVYSNATIVNSATMTGGIAGWIYAEEKKVTGAKISNCWFDGAITGCYGVGGILGGTYMWVNNTHPITATIEHCLNTGSIELSNDGGYVGGIIGQMQNAGSTITVNDSLNVGIYDGNGYTCKDDTLGTVVGRVTSTSVLTVNNTYGATEFASVLYGTVTTEATNWVDANSSCAALAKENLVGLGNNNGAELTLDFANHWTARTTSTPILTIFAADYVDAASGWLLDAIPVYEGSATTTLSSALYSSGEYLSDYTDEMEISVNTATNKMMRVDDTTAEEVAAYAEKLETLGYAVESNTTMENNTFYRLTKHNQRIYVNYYGNESRATIELDESGSASATKVSYSKPANATGETEYYLYGLKMRESRSSTDTTYPINGACMIIKCADNSIIMIDGGSSKQMNETEQARLYQFLLDITGQSDGAEVTISAWFITHFDEDHCGGFAKVLKNNTDKYTLERVICNLPDLDVTNKGNDDGAVSASEAIAKYSGCQEIKLRTGDKIEIAGVKLNALFTHSDYANANGTYTPASNSLFNSTSSVAMFTSPEGMQMLVTGDMFADTERILCSNFSATTLACDIIQQPHHNDGTDVTTIYDYASVNIVLFTQRKNVVESDGMGTGTSYATATSNGEKSAYYGGTETVGFKWTDSGITPTVYDDNIYTE